MKVLRKRKLSQAEADALTQPDQERVTLFSSPAFGTMIWIRGNIFIFDSGTCYQLFTTEED
jgi:hypothetical protein